MNNHVSLLEIDGRALEHNLNYFKKKLQTTTKNNGCGKSFWLWKRWGANSIFLARQG